VFNGVGASHETTPLSSIRLLIAEIPEKDAVDLRQATIQQKLDLLKSKDYRIVQEREVAYAISPNYFRPLSNLADLLSAVNLYQDYEVNTIPESLLPLVQQVVEAYNRSLSGFSKLTFSVAVVAAFETQQAVYQVEILPPIASKQEIATFFSGDLQSWSSMVHTRTAGLPQQSKDLVREIPSNANIRQGNVHKGHKSDSNPARDTPTMVLLSQSVPSWRLLEEDRAYFLARYYQLVNQEVAKEQARWRKIWQDAFQQAFDERPDWKGWQGNRWEGSWDQLPTDIRQKITTLLQAEGVIDELRGSHWRIEITPYIGLVQPNDFGTYFEHFPIKVIAK
jgi:hypothetical protein